MKTETNHHGIILSEGNRGSWDCGGAAFIYGTYLNEDSSIYLYYSGHNCEDDSQPLWSIGLAVSKDGINFHKINGAILEQDRSQFFSWIAWTPVVFKINDKYYMMFSGASRDEPDARLGIALADDPKGPFKIVKDIVRCKYAWEGLSVDLGPSVVYLGKKDIMTYYSNYSINKMELIRNMIYLTLRKRIIPSFKDLYRYVRRRIGILIIRFHEESKSIKVIRYPNNPLIHLNGDWGQWDESLFCPGYLKVNDFHHLFPATSTYSIGFPYRQYIGIVKGISPFFEKILAKDILINGSDEKMRIMPYAKSELALDTPCPLLLDDEIYLYYSVMDRYDGIWRVALSRFNINNLI